MSNSGGKDFAVGKAAIDRRLLHTTTAKDAANEADVAEWFFHDGTHLTVKQEEHSSESALRGN